MLLPAGEASDALRQVARRKKLHVQCCQGPPVSLSAHVAVICLTELLLPCWCDFLPQLRKLVATQEDLQEQLAAQLGTCQAESDAAAEAAAAQQAQLQQQLYEAQSAVAALADEIKVGG